MANLCKWMANFVVWMANLRQSAFFNETYRDWLQKPRSEQIKSQVAGLLVDTLFANTNTLLNGLDDQAAVFQFTNSSLYNAYILSRALDDSGGGSSSEGFSVQNYTVPANGFINFYSGTLNGATQLYTRVVGGNGIIICALAGNSVPCSGGFIAQPATTYKQSLDDYGLDTTKTNIQFTNNGTLPVTVRAGFAVS